METCNWCHKGKIKDIPYNWNSADQKRSAAQGRQDGHQWWMSRNDSYHWGNTTDNLHRRQANSINSVSTLSCMLLQNLRQLQILNIAKFIKARGKKMLHPLS